MYGTFTYIYQISRLKATIHVGKYTVRLMDGMGKYHKLQLQRSVQTPIDF